jgi:hypothetical protein
MLFINIYVIYKKYLIKYMLSKPFSKGRIGKLILILFEFILYYMS